jgi:hypothetical protein
MLYQFLECGNGLGIIQLPAEKGCIKLRYEITYILSVSPCFLPANFLPNRTAPAFLTPQRSGENNGLCGLSFQKGSFFPVIRATFAPVLGIHPPH